MSRWLMTRVVLPVPVSPKIAMFLAASGRLKRRWSHHPAVWPSAESVPVASPIQSPKSPGVLTSGPDRWRDVDLFADERKGRKRFAIEHVHERPKTDAAHDRGTGERREVVGVGEGERGRRNGADREHPEARGTLAKALA